MGILDELLEKKKVLLEKWKNREQEFRDLSKEIDVSFGEVLREFGIFEAQWYYHEDIGNYSTHSGILYLRDHKYAEKVCNLAKKYSLSTYNLADYVHLRFYDQSVAMIFDLKVVPGDFIRSRSIKVDFSFLDQKVEEINKIKLKFGALN